MKAFLKLVVINLLAYTFLVYNNSTLTFFNSPYISSTFFSSSGPLKLTATFGTLAVGLGMRPLGGKVLGPLGDIRGRRVLTRLGSVGSFLPLVGVALLPGYPEIGPSAPLAFLTLTAIQGFFTGALSGGVNVIGLESLEEKHRGWFSGSGMAVSGTSFLVASAVFYFLSTALGWSNYASWGWRVMFLTGFPIVILGFLIPESTKFSRPRSTQPLSRFKRELGLTTSLTAAWGSLTFTAQTVLPSLSVGSVSTTQLLVVYSVATLISAFTGGAVSEFLGRRRTSALGALMALGAAPAYFSLGECSSAFHTLSLVGILSFLLVFGGGGIMAFVNECFPTEVRSSAVALAWNVGFTLAGVSSVVASFVGSRIGSLAEAEGWMVIAVSSVALAVSLLSKETRGALDLH